MKKYPAKLLLFGEHTVNLGSQALATTLPLYSGQWQLEEDTARAKEKQMRLPELAAYLNGLPLFIKLDTNRLIQDIKAGWYFKSSIPTGYGVGSSGALIAAIFDRYCMVREGKDLSILKKTLAQMESFFHGTSSGTDPLICYLNKPVLMGQEQVSSVEIPIMEAPYHLFLLDTGIERQATPYIHFFLDKFKTDLLFHEQIKNDYLPEVNKAIDHFIAGKWLDLFQNFHTISHFQWASFDQLIPQSLQQIWQAGIQQDFFKLKICGAGGGGFILGMTNNFEKLTKDFNLFSFIKL